MYIVSVFRLRITQAGFTKPCKAIRNSDCLRPACGKALAKALTQWAALTNARAFAPQGRKVNWLTTELRHKICCRCVRNFIMWQCIKTRRRSAGGRPIVADTRKSDGQTCACTYPPLLHSNTRTCPWTVRASCVFFARRRNQIASWRLLSSLLLRQIPTDTSNQHEYRWPFLLPRRPVHAERLYFELSLLRVSLLATVHVSGFWRERRIKAMKVSCRQCAPILLMLR